MFDKIESLISQLTLTDNGNYNQCKNARKVLQEIKKEAQLLRESISEEFKKVKKTPKVKMTEDEVVAMVKDEVTPEKAEHPQFVAAGENEIEEPKLVQEADDEFFDKQ